MGSDAIRLQSEQVNFADRIFTTTTVVGSPAAAAETIVASVTVTTDLRPDQSVLLFGWLAYTVGTNGTSGRLRIRRTDASGATKADSGAVTRVAAQLISDSICAVDALGDAVGQVYVMTLTVAAGSAASTVSAVALTAIVI